MKREQAIKYVEKEIKDLGYNPIEVSEVYANAIELAEIAPKKEVTKYIEEMLDLYPNWDGR